MVPIPFGSGRIGIILFVWAQVPGYPSVPGPSTCPPYSSHTHGQSLSSILVFRTGHKFYYKSLGSVPPANGSDSVRLRPYWNYLICQARVPSYPSVPGPSTCPPYSSHSHAQSLSSILVFRTGHKFYFPARFPPFFSGSRVPWYTASVVLFV